MGLSREATKIFGREVSSEEVFELEKQGDDNAIAIVNAGIEAIGSLRSAQPNWGRLHLWLARFFLISLAKLNYRNYAFVKNQY